MVLITCLVIKPVTAKTNEEKMNVIKRINYGVVFKQESFLYMSSEDWLHTFEVELPQNVNLPRMSFCFDNNNECSTVNSMVNFIHSLHDSTESQLFETIKAIHTLVPQTEYFYNKKSERSLLPFIGSMAKGIFGLATMSDVHLLARHINELNKRSRVMANVLQQHGSHFSSFMTLIDNRTNNLMNGVKTNAAEIKQITYKFYNSLTSFQHSMTNISKILITLVNNANILRENLNQLQSSIQSLAEGRISPFLLPKHILAHSLHKIQRIMSESYPGFHLTHFDPSYYYTHSNFVYARNHSRMYITVKFPISAHAKPLNLFKVYSLPVPVNNTSSHATKLMSLPKYFAITNNNDFYAALSTDDLTNCKHGITVFCSTNIQLTPIYQPSCIIALFSNNLTMVKQLCNFRFLLDHIVHKVIELTPTSVLVYKSNNDLTLKCPDNSHVVPPCPLCIVHVPCRCSLLSHKLYFAPKLINCYDEKTMLDTKTSSALSVLHPVNLALLTEFFDQTKLNNILGDTTFPSQVALKVPNFKIYSHNMSNILVADQQDHLSLRKMAQAAKKDEQIFKTLTEPLITGDISLNSEWPDLNAILIFVALTIGCLSFITCIYLFFKVRKMAIAMLILKQVSNVKA
ncbi:unnamed protein product [Mytilus coruscus]|uniref:Envelope fusion protein n=1 Tax=Mytilus coruscus TaxID=42192 RepID=A0A6J8AMS3_MYTCO|nr:unnamed protein product [Mytilus coruscus]